MSDHVNHEVFGKEAMYNCNAEENAESHEEANSEVEVLKTSEPAVEIGTGTEGGTGGGSGDAAEDSPDVSSVLPPGDQQPLIYWQQDLEHIFMKIYISNITGYHMSIEGQDFLLDCSTESNGRYVVPLNLFGGIASPLAIVNVSPYFMEVSLSKEAGPPWPRLQRDEQTDPTIEYDPHPFLGYYPIQEVGDCVDLNLWANYRSSVETPHYNSSVGSSDDEGEMEYEQGIEFAGVVDALKEVQFGKAKGGEGEKEEGEEEGEEKGEEEGGPPKKKIALEEDVLGPSTKHFNFAPK